MTEKNLNIDSKKIGNGNPVYFIADIAANHDGDIELKLTLPNWNM